MSSTWRADFAASRSEEHTSELQSRQYLVCRLLLEKKNQKTTVLPRQARDDTHHLLCARCERGGVQRRGSRRLPDVVVHSCLPALFFFFLMIRRPPKSTLFPYPPLFR